ncbi:MAG: hypothetical protein D6734_00025 [Candidatus Schekmanbacteria bacterium]|nr:MAG: hypothetical protein D6734_00025 [Candidatus Schekmanbacteria bacterium]
MTKYEKTVAMLEKKFSGNGIKLGLERILRAAERVGNPQSFFKSIIVAGTNGKGSVSAMLSSIMNNAGVKSGLYTSPHLFDIRERIRVEGKKIDKKRFLQIVNILENAGISDVTYFEFLTLLSFLFFKEREVESAVLEVGLGGRFDAVNIAESNICIITGIAVDHIQYLGNTIEKIAFEKAGVIRNRGIVISGKLSKKAYEVIEKECKKKSAKLLLWGRDFKIDSLVSNLRSSVFDYMSEDFICKNIKVPLAGEFQPYNASLAITAFLEFLRLNKKKKKGIEIESAIQKGLYSTKWRGRMERIKLKDIEILFDCAHNSNALKYITSYISKEIDKREVILIFGVLSDKDIPKMLSLLNIRGLKIIFTTPCNERAFSPYELKKVFDGDGVSTSVIANPFDAFKEASKKSASETLVCIAGSIYLVAPLLQFVDRLKKNDKSRKKLVKNFDFMNECVE